MVLAAEKKDFAMPQTEAMELMAAAHEMCPYSKATRSNTEVTLFVD